jgi:hypothetical protein
MTVTLGFIILALVLIFTVDLILIWWRGYTATISWTLLVWSKKFPVIPFLVGITMGHLFWPNEIPDQDCKPKQEQVP